MEHDNKDKDSSGMGKQQQQQRSNGSSEDNRSYVTNSTQNAHFSSSSSSSSTRIYDEKVRLSNRRSAAVGSSLSASSRPTSGVLEKQLRISVQYNRRRNSIELDDDIEQDQGSEFRSSSQSDAKEFNISYPSSNLDIGDGPPDVDRQSLRCGPHYAIDDNMEEEEEEDNDRSLDGNKNRQASEDSEAQPGAYHSVDAMGRGGPLRPSDDIDPLSVQQVSGHQDTDVQPEVAIAAEVTMSDEEIEDQVRQRILDEAVQAETVHVDSERIQAKVKGWWFNSRSFLGMLLVVVLIIVAAIVPILAISHKSEDSISSPSSSPTQAPLLVPITILFQLDQFPQETGWSLKCGRVVHEDVPEDTYNTSFQLVMETFEVENGAECQLNITDIFADGFCCHHGAGYYQVYLGNDTSIQENIILDKTGEFGPSIQTTFTASRPQITSSPAPTTTPAPTFTILWTQTGQDLNGRDSNDRSGYSVSLSNNASIVAIGAPGLFSEDNPGHVKVWKYDDDIGSWSLLGLDLVGDHFDDHFGSSVSLSRDGTILAVGSHAPGTERPGSVRVYKFTANWFPLGQKIDGDTGGDEFGTSVSMNSDGSIVAIGAPFNSNTNGDRAGRVSVYQYNRTASLWIQLGQDIDGDVGGDQFGFSVSLGGNDVIYLAAGAPSPGTGRPGYTKAFRYDAVTNTWLPVGNTIEGESNDGESGTSVCLSGDGTRMAVGSPLIFGGVGYAQVFELDSGNWTQLGQYLVGDSTGDGAAESISLSDDGLTIAVGARNSADGAGHVKLFQYDEKFFENLTGDEPWNGWWHQIGEDIEGHVAGNTFGDSVSLSGDGDTIAIGAPFANNNNGDVRVFTQN